MQDSADSLDFRDSRVNSSCIEGVLFQASSKLPNNKC